MLGVPYTADMIAHASARRGDAGRPTTVPTPPISPSAIRRRRRAISAAIRGRVTEADALIAYLQMLGTLVDFKLYDDKANIR